MNYPDDRKYTKEHEWAKSEGKSISIGITHHAQSALGDIVFLDLPAPGRVLRKGEVFGVVESIKAVSDLYSPVDGKVLEANTSLVSDPSAINRSAHEQGWMIRVEAGQAPLEGMMTSAEYAAYVQTLV